MNWPYHVKVTYSDDTVVENDYASGFDPIGYARYMSGLTKVKRVDVSVSYVNGVPVSPNSGRSRAH